MKRIEIVFLSIGGWLIGWVIIFLVTEAASAEKLRYQIETQKKTIEHLNFIISRHDTTHSKCFKIK